MTATPFDLSRLLSGSVIPEFFSNYWEHRHLLLKRQQPDFYDPLITTADLEHFISNTDARYPAIQLAKGGRYFSAESYTRDVKHGDESFLGVPNVQRISDEYRRGATVALPALHRSWQPLAALCEQLQAELDHAVHANAYITPGYAAGFTPHYDTHEVFVLQIAGKKRWSLYAPVIDLPYRTQPFTPQAYSGQAPATMLDLEAGDLLYLPRGVLHSTTTSDSFSAHITIGITVFTWVDLLKELTQGAIADKELRRALPPGFASRPDIKPILEQRFAEAFDRLRRNTNPGPLIDGFLNRVNRGRGLRPAPFKANVTVVTLECSFQSPSAASYHVIEEGDKTSLVFKDVRYQITAPVAHTIRAMGSTRTFRGLDLDGPLDSDNRLVLLRHLVDIGFLIVV